MGLSVILRVRGIIIHRNKMILIISSSALVSSLWSRSSLVVRGGLLARESFALVASSVVAPSIGWSTNGGDFR